MSDLVEQAVQAQAHAQALQIEQLQSELTAVHQRLADVEIRLNEANERANRAAEGKRVLEADLRFIGQSLLEEAQSRDWCSDYDAFADSVNGHTSQPWLQNCSRTRTATFTVTVQGDTTLSEDDFVSSVHSALENIDPGDMDEVEIDVQLR